MSRKNVSAIIMFLLVLGTLALAFDVHPVKSDYVWTETIYIQADGSIQPPTAPISSVDNVTYTLTDNIVGNATDNSSAIIIQRGNIIIDGAGHTLQETQAFNTTGIELIGISNVTIKNVNIMTYLYGIWISSSSNNSVSGNNITNNEEGIEIDSSSFNNSFSGNNIANSLYGVYLYHSSNISIGGNNITNNGYGVWLWSSFNNSISGNNMANNLYGMWLYSSSNDNIVSGNNIIANSAAGVMLYSSSNNSVSGNTFTNNGKGIEIDWSSSNNDVSGNSITDCGSGIVFYSSSYNSIFHNNFINNAQQVYSSDSANVWDDGYPSGGNYWSDYSGTDYFGSFYQNGTGSDGIGDTPYIIDANNRDNYPLMKAFPWSEHDIGITYIGRIYSFDIVVPLKTIVGIRSSLNISTFVMNYGNQTESFNVQVYANDALVDTFENVTLESRQSAILNLRWNTTGFAYGNYIVRAVAGNLAGETDVSDNAYADGIVYVGIPGDVNGDGKVDMKDIGYVAMRFGMKPNDPRWSSYADLDDDGKINMYDVGFAARHFMEFLP